MDFKSSVIRTATFSPIAIALILDFRTARGLSGLCFSHCRFSGLAFALLGASPVALVQVTV